MKRATAIIATLIGALVALAQPAAAQRAPHPLFAGDETIRLTITGEIGDLVRSAERSEQAVAATLALAGTMPESHAIGLAPRGLSRRRRDVCAFPPLRIEFRQPPAASSFFRGQRRLKLVTHCRPAEGHQNFLLLEYAAYRLLNVLTPVSLRVRLAQIDYVEQGSARPLISRLGFLIEDTDDAARRNGLSDRELGARVPIASLSAREAGRAAVFHYMIGNLDWAMNAGPAGDSCCHNNKLFGAAAGGASGLIPVPYDFDFSGLVNAPYAVPPEQVPVRNVRTRRYRGFCAHNAEAQAAAAEFLAARPALLAALSVPGLAERSRATAQAYLEGFFRDIATPAAVNENLLRTCL